MKSLRPFVLFTLLLATNACYLQATSTKIDPKENVFNKTKHFLSTNTTNLEEFMEKNKETLNKTNLNHKSNKKKMNLYKFLHEIHKSGFTWKDNNTISNYLTKNNLKILKKKVTDINNSTKKKNTLHLLSKKTQQQSSSTNTVLTLTHSPVPTPNTNTLNETTQSTPSPNPVVVNNVSTNPNKKINSKHKNNSSNDLNLNNNTSIHQNTLPNSPDTDQEENEILSGRKSFEIIAQPITNNDTNLNNNTQHPSTLQQQNSHRQSIDLSEKVLDNDKGTFTIYFEGTPYNLKVSDYNKETLDEVIQTFFTQKNIKDKNTTLFGLVYKKNNSVLVYSERTIAKDEEWYIVLKTLCKNNLPWDKEVDPYLNSFNKHSSKGMLDIPLHNTKKKMKDLKNHHLRGTTPYEIKTNMFQSNRGNIPDIPNDNLDNTFTVQFGFTQKSQNFVLKQFKNEPRMSSIIQAFFDNAEPTLNDYFKTNNIDTTASNYQLVYNNTSVFYKDYIEGDIGDDESWYIMPKTIVTENQSWEDLEQKYQLNINNTHNNTFLISDIRLNNNSFSNDNNNFMFGQNNTNVIECDYKDDHEPNDNDPDEWFSSNLRSGFNDEPIENDNWDNTVGKYFGQDHHSNISVEILNQDLNQGIDSSVQRSDSTFSNVNNIHHNQNSPVVNDFNLPINPFQQNNIEEEPMPLLSNNSDDLNLDNIEEEPMPLLSNNADDLNLDNIEEEPVPLLSNNADDLNLDNIEEEPVPLLSNNADDLNLDNNDNVAKNKSSWFITGVVFSAVFYVVKKIKSSGQVALPTQGEGTVEVFVTCTSGQEK